MQGFFNMVLRVNLSQKSFDLKIISDDLLRGRLGGKGLAAHLLLTHNPAGADPLGLANHLVFATGPATGAGLAACACHGVFSKSPRTGLFCEAYPDGPAAERLAATGFDACMIHGAAAEPVWLEVSEDAVHFHPAGELWGLDAPAAAQRVRAWIRERRPQRPESAALAVGSDGERFSFDAATAGETGCGPDCAGLGAVMGGKRVKAIAFWGARRKTLANPGLLRDCAATLAAQADPGMGPEPASAGASAGLETLADRVAELVQREDRQALCDSLILCRAADGPPPWRALAALLKGVTGLDLDESQMQALARAIVDDVRRFDLREGGGAPDAQRPLPRLAGGLFPAAGHGMAAEQMDQALAAYYRARGWDEQGRPAGGVG
ncbi:MAG: aldehyde ferredoxin oxidoreductase N-terminal domain-containing protein [Thermodesulfobacteriota bacterium]